MATQEAFSGLHEHFATFAFVLDACAASEDN